MQITMARASQDIKASVHARGIGINRVSKH